MLKEDVINYGERARRNGSEFEDIIVQYYNRSENRMDILKKINKILPNIDSSGYFIKCPVSKTSSIHGRKTTRKADVWYVCGEKKVGISVKMSNKGTQLQIISLDRFIGYLEFYNVKMSQDVKDTLGSFLGLKDKKRLWFNEMELVQQDEMVSFFRDNYEIVMKLIFSVGLCEKREDIADIFVFNDSSYTETKDIKPIVYTYDEILDKLKSEVCITKSGNLQLNRYIGFQMKGSGKGLHYHSIQFKDRGINKD